MGNIAEEIWKIIVWSLAISAISISLLHYIKDDKWWRMEVKGSEESEKGPLIFYSIKGMGNDEEILVELYIKNTLQEYSKEIRGVFDKILPGQTVFLKVRYRGESAFSPAFIVKDREIKHLTFKKNVESVNFLRSSARQRETSLVKKNNFNENPVVEFFAKIEKYRPLERASAKETKKKINKKIGKTYFTFDGLYWSLLSKTKRE